MNAKLRLIVGALALAGVASLVGCGTEAGVAQVKGKVAFEDGSPLPERTMLVLSSTTGGVDDAYGVVDSNGEFELQRAAGGSGAHFGRYAVSVRAPEGSGHEFYEKFEKAYIDGSLLSVEVNEGTESLDLVLKSRAKGKKSRRS